MSYLRFDKTLMTNLGESLPKEILRTNRSGAYHCTTIVDCNTRKYHGLLVIPVPELDDENHVLLSSLDETVIQHGAEFNLGLHKYQGDNYSPRGHKYIREFECEKVPTTIYRVGGVILKKEKLFVHHENRILKLEESFNKLSSKRNSIIFEDKIYDAFSILLDIFNNAEKEIIIIDNFANKELLDTLKILIKI